jgi:hypothetical protein
MTNITVAAMSRNVARERQEICAKFDAPFVDVDQSQTMGVAENVRHHVLPINGLRLSPEGDFSGWYIWAGTNMHPKDDHFYKPLHVSHIDSWNRVVSKYLGLAPGWRFLVTEGHEDVWFDPSILG